MGSVARAQEIILKSRYKDLELPEGTRTLTDEFWPKMELWGDEIALICGLTKEEYSYRQVKEYAQNMSSALRALNIEKSSFIGMVSPMSPKAMIAFLGVWRAECTMVPLSHMYTKAELQRKFKSVPIETVITTNELLGLVSSSGTFKNVIVIAGEGIEGNGLYSFEEMIATSHRNVTYNPNKTDNKENIAIISSSTGTTGDSKNIAVSHFALLCNLRQQFSPETSNIKLLKDGDTRNLQISMYPPAHLSCSLMSLIWGFYQGIIIVCIPKFEPELYHSLFRQYKPTMCLLLTHVIKFIIDSPLFETSDLKTLKTIVAGGTPLPKQYIHDLMEKAQRNIVFLETYGTSEILVVTTNSPSLTRSKIGSVGEIFPNVRIKVVDLITGETLGPNKQGEILAKAPTLMMGYFNDKIATAEAIDSEGYYKTGDVGYYDEDEYFYIVDRVRDMIKVKGFQVAPKEIELEIRKHPKVCDVCVVGVPHERFGEAPRAFIIKNDESLLPDEINAFIRDNLSQYKHLSGGIEFVDEIPKVGNGKHLRRELQRKYLASIGRPGLSENLTKCQKYMQML